MWCTSSLHSERWSCQPNADANRVFVCDVMTNVRIVHINIGHIYHCAVDHPFIHWLIDWTCHAAPHKSALLEQHRKKKKMNKNRKFSCGQMAIVLKGWFRIARDHQAGHWWYTGNWLLLLHATPAWQWDRWTNGGLLSWCAFFVADCIASFVCLFNVYFVIFFLSS